MYAERNKTTSTETPTAAEATLQDNTVSKATEASETPEYTMFPQSDHFTAVYVGAANRRQSRLEVDTGASLSIITLSYVQEILASERIAAIECENEDIHWRKPCWLLEVRSRGEGLLQETAVLPLLIVEKEGPSLLGRNWLNTLRLDWSQAHHAVYTTCKAARLYQLCYNVIRRYLKKDWAPSKDSKPKSVLIHQVHLVSAR